MVSDVVKVAQVDINVCFFWKTRNGWCISIGLRLFEQWPRFAGAANAVRFRCAGPQKFLMRVKTPCMTLILRNWLIVEDDVGVLDITCSVSVRKQLPHALEIRNDK